MLRQALAHDDIAIAITDRAGRMVCANDLFATWFGGFVTPPGLPLEGQGADRLKNAGRAAWRDGEGHADRSEEHTSELQSLMRSSYAVFCLKKKKTTHTTNTDNKLSYKKDNMPN